jgi:hypothetical protein
MKNIYLAVITGAEHWRDHHLSIDNLLSKFFCVPVFQPPVQLAFEFDLPPAQRGV